MNNITTHNLRSNGSMVYKYVYRPYLNKPNYYRVGSQNTWGCDVIQDNNVKPVKRYTRRYKKFGAMDNAITEFYIPEGSIKEIYTIDVTQ